MVSQLYCDVPGSPCLSQIGQITCAVCSCSRWLRNLLIFVGLVHLWTDQRILGPCLVAAQAVHWRPHLTSTRQYFHSWTTSYRNKDNSCTRNQGRSNHFEIIPNEHRKLKCIDLHHLSLIISRL